MSSYSLLKEEHDNEPAVEMSQESYRFRSGKPQSIIVIAGITLSLILSTLGLFFSLFNTNTINHSTAAATSQPAKETNNNPFQCGFSPIEARARGCIFDPMAFNWLPPACHNPEITAEFLSLANWTYSPSPLGHPAYTSTDIMNGVAGDFEYLYVDQKFHHLHCTYMTHKVARALASGDPDRLDGYIVDPHHSRHCIDMSAMGPPSNDRNAFGVMGPVRYPACGKGVFEASPAWWWVYRGEKFSDKNKEREVLNRDFKNAGLSVQEMFL